MTHSAIVDFFNYNNITINSLVEIQLLSGEVFVARIANSKVLFKYDSNGIVVNSHIKIVHSKALIEYNFTQIPFPTI